MPPPSQLSAARSWQRENQPHRNDPRERDAEPGERPARDRRLGKSCRAEPIHASQGFMKSGSVQNSGAAITATATAATSQCGGRRKQRNQRKERDGVEDTEGDETR